MTTALDQWLDRATRCLSKDSAERVRTEIREHYESARTVALSSGAAADEADRRALAALGDAEATNREYRKALLTSAEARILRQGKWEAMAFCVRGQARAYAAALTVVALAASAAFFINGHADIAREALAATLAMSLISVAPRLPVYTRSRSRIVRFVKWAVLLALPILALGPDALKYSWLFAAALGPGAWAEWQRAQIRRKLPISEWPKHLYL